MQRICTLFNLKSSNHLCVLCASAPLREIINTPCKEFALSSTSKQQTSAFSAPLREIFNTPCKEFALSSTSNHQNTSASSAPLLLRVKSSTNKESSA
jgi:hypothetical protein